MHRRHHADQGKLCSCRQRRPHVRIRLRSVRSVEHGLREPVQLREWVIGEGRSAPKNAESGNRDVRRQFHPERRLLRHQISRNGDLDQLDGFALRHFFELTKGFRFVLHAA